MTLILNQSDWNDLWQQAPASQANDLTIADCDGLACVSEAIGQGYHRYIQLSPEIGLSFEDCQYHQDVQVNVSAHDHPIQFGVHLSGFIYFDAVHPNLGGNRGYFSGSGISPGYVENYRGGERLTLVGVEIDPDWFAAFLHNDRSYNSEMQNLLFKGEDWKNSFYPTVTPAMRSLAQQMWNAPYRGAAKRLYLQAKVFELLAMHLDWIADVDQTQVLYALKPDRISCLHHAKDILTRQFAQPPALPELAAQVGLSPRSLQRGFQMLFHTTISGYLKQRRLEQAEQLFRQGNQTVAEVALQVGYGHLGHFATAFKQQFGITPSQCLAGKRGIQLD
jgi:AraC-like DNA-binding protein